MKSTTRSAPGKCRSCGALIHWAYHAKTANKMPVDAEPREDGNLVLVLAMAGRAIMLDNSTVWVKPGGVIVERFNAELHKGRNRYVSHHSTCPEAEKWRRKQ